MKLNASLWKSFYLKDLYIIKMGDKLDKNKMSTDCPTVNFVSRISYNNGVDTKVDKIDNLTPHRAGLLTVALGGEYLGSCYIQNEPFYTAQNVAIMEPRFDNMTDNVNRFICTLVKFECQTKYYAFGRELNTHINTDFQVNLPIKLDESGDIVYDDSRLFSEDGYIPDWEFMIQYIESLHNKPLTTKNITKHSKDFDTNTWHEFDLIKLFDIERGKITSLNELNEGVTPIVSASGENEGISFFADIEAPYNNNITISMNGVNTGFTAYHGYPFNINVDCCVLKQKFKLNKYIAIFIVTIINQLRCKYSYGRKMSAERIEKEKLKLPIQKDFNGLPVIDSGKEFSDEGFIPDWKYMEKYIAKLHYGDRL